MSAKVVWQGLDEFRADLRNLPVELSGEASEIVIDAAFSAAADVRAAYEAHRRSGNLAKGVRVDKAAGGPFGAKAIVKSTAQHAFIFENGTQARHTDIGADRGSMPPGNVFVPRMIRHRRAMYERLKAMMQRHGLVVRGNP